LRPRHDHVARRHPGETAIVADIHLAVGAKCCAVRPARDLRHGFLAAVGIDPRQPLPADFDQHHRAVGHDYGSFGTLETGGKAGNIGHENPPASFLAAGGMTDSAPAHATMMLPAVMTK